MSSPNSVQELMDSLGTAKTVTQYLGEVNYKDDKDYVPSDFALGFVVFIKLVNGENPEEHQTPVAHFKMLDAIAEGNSKIANLCHRGLGKTTLLKEYLILYMAVYNELPNYPKMINFVIYVSDSIENGVKNMRKNLEYRWENSEFLQQFIPKTKWTDIHIEFTNVGGTTLVLKQYGARTGVRGARANNKRPQIALLDDLVSDEDARSATVIATIEDTVHKAVSKALDPVHMIVWSGTPFNSRDPLYKAIESGTWTVNVFPVCEEFPVDRQDFRGSWEDRFTYDYVLAQYVDAVKNGRISDFNQELMLKIMSEEDKVIFEEDIRWYNRNVVISNPNNYHWYITTDYATSHKEHADYSVTSVWAYNSNGDWFWVDGFRKRQTVNDNINKLFELVRQYRPMSVGIEISGQQQGFISIIQDKMHRENCFFNLASKGKTIGIRPTTDKFSRFMAIVPLFKQGKIYFPESMRNSNIMEAAVDELSLVSSSGFKSKNDDFLDTISMLAFMDAIKPSEEVFTQDNNSDDSYWGHRAVDEDVSPMSSYIV